MRFAVRRLLRFPGTTLISIVLLACSIGATTAVYTVASAYVLSPIFPQQERLYVIWPELANGNRVEIAYPELLAWEPEIEGFSHVAAMWSATLKRLVPSGDRVETVPFRWVSASFFDTLGVSPHLGRAFELSDVEPGAGCSAIVSFGLWQSRYGARTDVLGDLLEGDEPCRIVGVMPPGFGFPKGVDLWLALRREGEVMNRGLGVLWAVGRLAEGTAPETARLELDALNRRLDDEQLGNAMPVTMRMRPIVQEHLGASTAPVLVSLLAAVGLLLLIACANVATVGVTRALSRREEIRTQRALGASPARIVVEHLWESLLVAGAGAALGLAFTRVLLALLPALDPPNLPNLDRIEVNGEALAFALAAAALAALAPGLVAATGSRHVRRGRIRDGLVVAQIALAMMLLTGAALCLRSFLALADVDLGYEPKNVLSAILVPPSSDYPELEDRRAFVESTVDRLRTLPGVRTAAAVLLRPFELGSGGWGSYLLLEGETPEGDAFTRNPEVNFQAVTPDYFRTMGIRLLAGRDFSEGDSDDAPRVTIVSRGLAARLWPGETALGKRLLSSYGSGTFDASGKPRFQRVIGIVEDVRYRGLLLPYLDLYVPYRQSNPQPNQIVLRTRIAPETMATLVRDEIRAQSPSVALDGMTTLDALVARELRPWRFSVQVFTFLGAVAAGLASLGLFGLLALGVRERRREIGVRAVLGASPGLLLKTSLSEGASLCAMGVAFGLAGSLVLARALRSVVYAIDLADLPTLLGVATALFATSLAASLLPARQASRVSPAEALRQR